MSNKVFQDIQLVWKGETYTIEADRLMGCIGQIEEIVTFGELLDWRKAKNIKVSKLSSAYGTALRYAGVVVTDEEVYAGCFSKEGQTIAMQAVTALLQLMLPPQDEETNSAGGKS